MKISKIPGLGSYGQYIDNVDFNNLTDDQWLEIGKSHLKNLVTVIRNPVGLTKDKFYHGIGKFGPTKGSGRIHFAKKYGRIIDALDEKSLEGVSDDDKAFLKNRFYMIEETEEGNLLPRIYGQKDKDGNMLGAFDIGDVGWHSNEGGQLTFSPEVALMGHHKMVGSATGFFQTADYYESVSNSFRSELDEMILVHTYKPGAISPAELDNDLFRSQVQINFCPTEGLETPMVLTSPGGIRGLHYPVNTISHIKGMSADESRRIIDTIESALLAESNTFYHYYQHDNDLLLFDNSITNHCRLGGDPERLAYRIQYEPCNLLDGPWYPYDNPEILKEYVERTHELVKVLQIKNFKLPSLDKV